MAGLRATGGGLIDGWAHVCQSIQDILTTPVGSRVLRREYGSDLPRLIDQPLTDQTLLRIYGAVAIALLRWEPRIELTSVAFTAADAQGRATIALWGDYLPRGHLGDKATREAFQAVTVNL